MFVKKASALEETDSKASPKASNEMMSNEKKTNSTGKKTRISIKYDVGFNNTLYIRGNGGNLSWNKGLPLKNIKADEWVWETNLGFPSAEFKVLINDRQYEIGDNHKITGGAEIQYTPKF